MRKIITYCEHFSFNVFYKRMKGARKKTHLIVSKNTTNEKDMIKFDTNGKVLNIQYTDTWCQFDKVQVVHSIHTQTTDTSLLIIIIYRHSTVHTFHVFHTPIN